MTSRARAVLMPEQDGVIDRMEFYKFNEECSDEEAKAAFEAYEAALGVQIVQKV